jgi:hypothetical protein
MLFCRNLLAEIRLKKLCFNSSIKNEFHGIPLGIPGGNSKKFPKNSGIPNLHPKHIREITGQP